MKTEVEESESTGPTCSRLENFPTQSDLVANGDADEHAKSPEPSSKTMNPFNSLVNGHGQAVNISEESRISARNFFQQGKS